MSDSPWWQRTTVYQVYPRSFSDSNADGIGDLPGVIERLDYLRWLGVETIWLSPFYRSPQTDFGYDISDHFDIAPEYGDLDDCRRLIDETHARGMKIVLDMVLNHTSIEHPWFQESRSGRDSPRRDFYIWRDGRRPGGAAPPNNWRSMLGGSGWCAASPSSTMARRSASGITTACRTSSPATRSPPAIASCRAGYYPHCAAEGSSSTATSAAARCPGTSAPTPASPRARPRGCPYTPTAR